MADRSPCDVSFERVVIDDIDDGYWLGAADLDGDGRPDLVASGVEFGKLVWYRSPSWERRPVGRLDHTVASVYADIDGDGHVDIVVCHDFGGCPWDCGPEDGKISWLRNPGVAGGSWTVHPIAGLVGVHRLVVGHFSQRDRLEVLAVPIVGVGGMEAPAPVVVYRVPEDPRVQEWHATTVNDSDFRLIHDVVVGNFGATSDPQLDQFLLASAEGVSWLRVDDGTWRVTLLGRGRAEPVGGVFTGTGNVAAGSVAGDPVSYIAAVEPFHGSHVVVYTKDRAAAPAGHWQRRVLDVLGEPNQRGEATGHHVVTADFDGDGDDEFLVGFRGPPPAQGVYYYDPVDVAHGEFARTQVTDASASTIAVADFDGDGRLDFAITAHHTPGLSPAGQPQVLLFGNRFGSDPHDDVHPGV